jgi:acylphosphatase
MEKQAVYLGATGWVRNLPDGRVEAVIEGTSDVVERMTSWCREGPRSAQVTDVTVETESVEGFEEFEIRY